MDNDFKNASQEDKGTTPCNWTIPFWTIKLSAGNLYT